MRESIDHLTRPPSRSLRALRTFAQLVRADYLERVRRHGFLVTLAVTLWFAYVFLPPLGAHYVTLQVGGHRGLYGSAWVGAAVSILASVFLSLVGFFLVKNSIDRDRRTGVGQILATTPMSKPLYTLGKTASNFAVLATLAVLLAVGALGMQLLRAEDTRIDLPALLVPFVVVTLPALVGVSAAAVLFESVTWLRGGLGNVVYFFSWGGLLVGSMPKHQDRFSGIGDLLGAAAVLPSILHAAAAAFPGLDPRTAPLNIGFNFSPSHAGELTTFVWDGPQWTAQVLVARLAWVALGVMLALAASIPFDRFDTAVAPARPRRSRGARGPEPAPAAGESPDVARSTASLQASSATLAVARRSGSFVPLLRGELTLMLGRQPWGWWLIAAGLAVACVAAPLGVAREFLLPFALLWPVLVWSPMGARESLHSTEALLFTSPRPLARQLAACWTAGALVSIAAGLGVGARLIATGDGAGALAMLGGAVFVPTLALACGAWTGNGRLFEVLYLLLWYVGPMNHLGLLDYAATRPEALTAGTPLHFAIATLALAVLAVLGRSRRLRGI